MNTTDKNKLIAEFMGVKFDKGTFYNMGYDIFSNGNLYRGHELEYHKSWDWLIPVIKKINLQLHPDTRGAWRMITHCVEYKIEDVHNQVVEFIKQYNENENERLNNEYISYNDAPYGQD
mgnify:CR=1 FL=1